jgi:hypothetical protein
MDVSALVKMLCESPALQGMIMSAIGQAWLKFADGLNKAGVSADLKKWLQPAYMVMSFLAYLIDGVDKGNLNTDPNAVQNVLTLYANTLVMHTGLELGKKKLNAKSLPLTEAKEEQK